MSLHVVILAAGMGKRMKSDLPKVLHPIADVPMLGHVVNTAKSLAPDQIIVIHGHGGDRVRATLNDPTLTWAEQTALIGTGDAVKRALPFLPQQGKVLILYGDVPLITATTLQRLLNAANDRHLGLLTAHLADPTGYGRIVRNAAGNVAAIVEQKDAHPAELAIGEINTGLMCVQAEHLHRFLARLTNNNAQQEYYLTDIIAMAVDEAIPVVAVQPDDVIETLGVNDRAQLAQLERAFQRRQSEALLAGGLAMADPSRFDLRGQLTFGRDCAIDVNVIIAGKVTLGERVRIGANCVLSDCELGDDVVVQPFSHLDGAKIGQRATIGPYARLRPGTVLCDNVHIGNFVETKKTVLGEGSKANHLTYLGDAVIGRDCNIGAGTITCNYDGANKFQTTLGDRVFVGSDTQFVAPVSVGDDATIGAGSTIRRDCPAGQLTLTHTQQKSVSAWKRPVKRTSK